MSANKVASLEIFRNVYSVDNTLLDKISTMGRLLLDEAGDALVTPRTDNVPRSTIIQAATVFDSLRYNHLKVAAPNVKHTYKKLYTARTRLEDGSHHGEPLEEIYARIATQHGSNEDVLQWELELDEVDLVASMTREGMRNQIVLRSTSARTKDTNLMLTRMSDVTRDVLERRTASDALLGMMDHELTDSVPVAKIATAVDPSRIKGLVDFIDELLPVTVMVDTDVVFENRG